ncbi:hypothetical protein K505DRAFT_236687 [Melanomma pulvis-pyrius CBS 109.77]|uniref:Mid2 domain-containing protein n=1 Tax=Melanomma pulvis-pyrius CBS 109.77 TaxID=1314802 RepID=A0A6A6XLY1_9PLEO|nr:hypothetical protein K505DRAFT_236687 [Melanomma pulvis-pyrius CBS 109.77]
MFRSILLYSLLPLLALAQESASATQTAPTSQRTPNTGYNGGEDNPQDPSDAGAAGASKGAFTLSKGGLAAIIVVAVLVAVGGTASAILFWLAKKRQWNVRQSIRRASRRLTGRSDVTNKRQNRRTGVRLNSPPPSKNAMSRQDKDVEKGVPANAQNGRTTTTITSTFDVDTPTQKGWKASMLGGKK